MTSPIIRILFHWRICLTLIVSEFSLAFPGGKKKKKGKEVSHLNFGFVTPVTPVLARLRTLVTSVSGRLTFNSSI